MLMDYPMAKENLYALLRQVLRYQIGQSEPFLARIPKYVLHEGTGTTLQRADNSADTTTMQEAGAGLVFAREEMKSLSFEGLVAKLSQVAKDLAEQQAGHVFSKIDEAVAKVGNLVDAQGKAFGKAVFLEVLEQLQVNFDRNTGRPTGPGLVIPRSRAKEFLAEIETWESDPDFHRQFDEIMAKKKVEWRAREDRRELAD